MTTLPDCPQCSSSYAYEDRNLLVCPECGHEWSPQEQAAEAAAAEQAAEVRDANGNPRADGDTVVVIKDLKFKGSSQVIKGGTKVRSIGLVEADHDIDCRIEGIGPMQLKSEFVRKA